MEASAEETGHRVRMETRQWLVIDATIDNEVSDAAESDDAGDVVALGSGIRRAGWDQIPGWPKDVEGFADWPAPGQMSTVSLSGAQWDLVVSALERWAAVADRRGTSEGRADGDRSRAIAALVRAQLAERGWTPR